MKTMKTKIEHYGEKVLVKIEGKLSYECTNQFKQELDKLNTQNKQVAFDMQELQFVGSSGISSFIQILREFNLKTASKPKYINFRIEFKKLIKAFDDEQSFDFSSSLNEIFNGPSPTDLDQ